jgi:hypothetical protein
LRIGGGVAAIFGNRDPREIEPRKVSFLRRAI